MVDFHALRLRREAELTSSASKLAEANAMEKLEVALFRGADIVFAVSDTERALVNECVPTARVYSLPNAFQVPASKPRGLEGRKNILFLGRLWHSPNFDAVDWFARDIWPMIRRAKPDIEFHVAGSNMDRRVYELEKYDGVKIIGYVNDLPAFFDGGRVFVAPLRFGAGMKGKVGQGMAFGLPVVTTSVGAEGMSIVNEREILLADTTEAFASAVIRLLESDSDWLRLQKEARSFVEQNLSPASLQITLRAAFSNRETPPTTSTETQPHASPPCGVVHD